MPGVANRINACGASDGTVYHNSLVGNGSSVSSDSFWSEQRGDTNYNQLNKFWCELTTQARQNILRIDKQTLFEHARKNMYCSRCNGMLLEDFLQIVLYGKSIQRDATRGHCSGQFTNNQNCGDLCNDNEQQGDVIDPSIHPWGGLTTARDGTLTLLDCYVHSKSLKGLLNVFDSARARERKRKLLYPDACGGGGRGWISQGMTGYGRWHGTRETCALHTARLSVETLVDFWSALGEETRQSLLRMKEEDFIEKLMYRFDGKRFCRDCRRNVIREFKELKELKRMRKDPCCTSWFCVADSVFQYEVSHDTVRADWHRTFLDVCGTYHHFEWAIGTGEGKSDIFDFKNVGLSLRVQVNGLDLSGLSACYITLRAWKIDGRCNELCVKAHALRGYHCVHCRLAVGDGYITISIGENIRKFFEHAEEAKEEEDDDSMEKDGNEFDGECSRPQKHAKSPELAREFLLDAATVIFKEQVEKAFREETARKNARSNFVCLGLKLLEERVHVACKDIITLEKQTRLLEEEEKEKHEEEKRKERRRTKEREKKLRRKERLREKETKEKKCVESYRDAVVIDTLNEAKSCVNEGVNIGKTRDCASGTGEATPTGSPLPPGIQDDQLFTGYSSPNMENHPEDNVNVESCNTRDLNPSMPYNYRYSRRKPRLQDTEQDLTLKWSDRRKSAALSVSELANTKSESRFYADGFEPKSSINCFRKQLRANAAKSNTRNGPKLSEKLQCTYNRVRDRCDPHVCSCNHHNDYRARSELHSIREPKYVNKLESSRDKSKACYCGKCTQLECAHEINGLVNTNANASNSSVTKKVWEPLYSPKKCVPSNSVALRPEGETIESDQVPESSGITTSRVLTNVSVGTNEEDNELRDLRRPGNETCRDTVKGSNSREKFENYVKVEEAEDGKLCFMARSPHKIVDTLLSSSSRLSEDDSNTSSSNCQNLESTSTSDSEEFNKTSDMSHCLENGFDECHKVVNGPSTRLIDDGIQEPASGAPTSLSSIPAEAGIYCENGKANLGINAQPQSVFPSMMYNQSIQYPVYQIPAMGYYHQSPVSWPAGPTNGLMSFDYPNHYLFANDFGYDLNTNPQLMQYGGLQHLPPPLISPIHMPVFPPVTQANAACTKDHANLSEVQLHHGVQTVSPSEPHSGETPIVVDGRQNGTSDEANANFSLFHFGGPVALSTGFKDEAVTLKEGAVSAMKLSEMSCCPDGNLSCNRKDSIEEYSLFDGIEFSIM